MNLLIILLSYTILVKLFLFNITDKMIIKENNEQKYNVEKNLCFFYLFKHIQ